MSRRGADVLVDVTSLISAEDFLLAQNHRVKPRDPFARQCFVELVQSLFLMSRVVVGHPVLANPRPDDFGEHPLLLRALLSAGLLDTLQLDREQQGSAEELDRAAVHDLESVHGITSVARFVDQAVAIDQANAHAGSSLSARIRAWSVFQEQQVRTRDGHHANRIPTRDGVEDDAYGEWARAAGVILSSSLNQIAVPGQATYLMATLARSMKYRARADAYGASYQSHPLRRDFSLTFDLTRDGTSDAAVFDVIQAVRGIPETLAEAAAQQEIHRLKILQLELPLLGGRLWEPSDTGTLGDAEWIALVVRRMREYRERAAALRQAVERCVSDEDYLRFARDIDTVTWQLLDRLGLRRAERSPLEEELIGSVASVTGTATGFPVVSGLWFGARALSKHLPRPGARPFQRFLYREFVEAWKRAGR